MTQFMPPPWQAEEDRLKKEYAARIYMRPTDIQFCIEQAFILIPKDADRAYAGTVGTNWPRDPLVIAEMERLRQDPIRVARAMPTQLDLARELWALGTNTAVEVKDRLKALDQYANVQGMGTGAKGGAVHLTMVNKVMVLPQPAATREENNSWIKNQQARLLADADASLSEG